MKRARAKPAWVIEMLEKLIVNESQLPVCGQWCSLVPKIWSMRHVESDLDFRRAVSIRNNSCREDSDFRDEDLAASQCAAGRG